MDNPVYTNLGNRINKTFRDKRESDLFTLKDFNESKWVIHSKLEFKVVLTRELKALLLKENLYELVQSFFDLETQVQVAREKLMIDDEILGFDEFYKNLSPVLMRSILEVANNSNNSEVLLNAIKESIRISIEEEIYAIEEKYES